MEIEPPEDKAIQKEVKEKHQGSKVTSEITPEVIKQAKVRCLCVNGLCNEGESKCRECFDGYEGDLCDIRSVSYNRSGAKNVIEDQDEVDEVFRKGKKSKAIGDSEQTSSRSESESSRARSEERPRY